MVLQSIPYTPTSPTPTQLHTGSSNRVSSLNDKHVVFGVVLKGMDVVRNIEKLGTQQGKPKKPIVVTACGELKPALRLVAVSRVDDNDSAESDTDGSSTEREK